MFFYPNRLKAYRLTYAWQSTRYIYRRKCRYRELSSQKKSQTLVLIGQSIKTTTTQPFYRLTANYDVNVKVGQTIFIIASMCIYHQIMKTWWPLSIQTVQMLQKYCRLLLSPSTQSGLIRTVRAYDNLVILSSDIHL